MATRRIIQNLLENSLVQAFHSGGEEDHDFNLARYLKKEVKNRGIRVIKHKNINNYDDALTYFDIGHGEFGDYESDPTKHYIWAFKNGSPNIEVYYVLSPEYIEELKEEGVEEGSEEWYEAIENASAETHGMVWGHENVGIKGRYEEDTGKLTIVLPDSKTDIFKRPELEKILEEFDNITEMHVF